ncbi:MAG: hypothetical protein OEY22_01715 [Candidatus Bathyarchaeota archaeon]|nr:hypothetical protein [Candidatus Bathyarchaeota archaeon]
MGLTGAIIHKGLAYLFQYLLLWVLLLWYLQIPPDKMPMVFLIVLLSGITGSLVASFMLIKYRGY